MRSRNTRRGPLACTSAALLSAVFPGLGHLAVRARFRPRPCAAVALNVLATAAALAIAGSARTCTDVAALVADRFTFLVLAAALATLAVTRLATAADAAWQARPRHGSARRGWPPATAIRRTGARVRGAAGRGHQLCAADRPCCRPGVRHPRRDHRLSGRTARTRQRQPTRDDHHRPGHLHHSQRYPAPVPPPATTTTLPPIVGEDRVNVLLLGGDAGPGRWSLRTDSIIVVPPPSNGRHRHDLGAAQPHPPAVPARIRARQPDTRTGSTTWPTPSTQQWTAIANWPVEATTLLLVGGQAGHRPTVGNAHPPLRAR